MKATARAHSNIAFIKYWGRKDEELRLPVNGSISMNLSNLHTTTTIEFSNNQKQDEFTIDTYKVESSKRFSKHLDRIRQRANISLRAKVKSVNTFPSSTGLSSSASGYAALTYAAVIAAGLRLPQRELSILARQGSGSACRSIPDGFVEWKDGTTSNLSYAESIFPSDHWEVVDIVAIVSKEKKEISTSESQKRAQTSPFFQTRINIITSKIEQCKKIIEKRDFIALGKLVESEAMELHAIMLTSWPPLIHLLPETITIMKAVQLWRNQGLPVFFTLNTGQDVHLICEKKNEREVQERLQSISLVKRIITNTPSRGTYLLDEHLF